MRSAKSAATDPNIRRTFAHMDSARRPDDETQVARQLLPFLKFDVDARLNWRGRPV